MAIDYARMQTVWPKQKRALTRASKLSDPTERAGTILDVCRAAVAEWESIGAWPDDWSRFQRALDDAFFAIGASAPRLERLA